MVDANRGGRGAAVLAIVALSALLLTPFMFQRTIARHRQVYTTSLDPARSATSEALLALSRQIAAIRGYVLTRDADLLSEYRSARIEQDSAFGRLKVLSHLDTTMTAEAQAFAEAAREWNSSNDLLADGAISSADAVGRLAVQQEKYLRALDAGQALDRDIVRAVDAMRERVGMLERRWATATIGLAVLAAIGGLMVILIMRSALRHSTLARTDALTGLYNRLGFDELAARELSRARRNASAVTLMSFDLDGFKQVNDQSGHAAGDDVLKGIGRALREIVRDIDVPARLGGDEFAVLLPDNRAQPPERAAERVRNEIMAAITREGWPVTVSVGAVTSIEADVAIDEMIRVSDKLMYAVKSRGKNGMKHELLTASPRGAQRDQRLT